MDYENFTVDSGVSTELIALLCESLKRNMYAYDEVIVKTTVQLYFTR